MLTYADLRPLLTRTDIPLNIPSGASRSDVNPIMLAREELCYVGEPVALVVAETLAAAQDAAERAVVLAPKLARTQMVLGFAACLAGAVPPVWGLRSGDEEDDCPDDGARV